MLNVYMFRFEQIIFMLKKLKKMSFLSLRTCFILLKKLFTKCTKPQFYIVFEYLEFIY